jgi:uncharacterized membrane protein
VNRRSYLDWLRGIGVLIMIEAHTLDSWTRAEDRGHAFGWALVIGGFGAPLFLFLAGMALVLAAGARSRKGLSDAAVAAQARRRAWQIFGLAFLFRLQSAAISGGWQLRSLLKVDILNVMGLSMLAAAVLWGFGRTNRRRAVLFSMTAIAAAMLTPVIRATPMLTALPDPIEWYLRPDPGRSTFTMFPWAGFLLGGCAIGLWLDRTADARAERRLVTWLAVLGIAIAAIGYVSSLLPPIYAETSFWTSSPTFFFVRLGILIASVALAYACMPWLPGWAVIVEFGVASLFVYWVHVEMVYGLPSVAIHRRLTLIGALVGFVSLSVFLFGLVRLKARIVGRMRRTSG